MSSADPWEPIEFCTLADIGVRGSPTAMVAKVDQRDAEWFSVRSGILTASNAALVVTSTGKAATGATRQSYLHGLVAERLTGSIEMQHTSLAMERGTNLEPQARKWYEFVTGREVQRVGFVFRNAKKDCGASPDGLCADRGIEIKCPMRRAMIGYLLRGAVPAEYVPQVQFQMWVTGLPRWDFVLYTPEPEIPNAVWTVEADPAMHAAFDEHVPAFCAEIEEAVRRLARP